LKDILQIENYFLRHLMKK